MSVARERIRVADLNAIVLSAAPVCQPLGRLRVAAFLTGVFEIATRFYPRWLCPP